MHAPSGLNREEPSSDTDAALGAVLDSGPIAGPVLDGAVLDSAVLDGAMLDGAMSDPDRDFAVLVGEVWSRLEARLERGLSRIEGLAAVLFHRSPNPDEVVEAIAVAELVAAKLGALGLGSAAELMRKGLAVLHQDELTMAHAVTLSSLLDDVRTTMAANVTELRELPARHRRVHLAVVGPVGECLDEVLWVATAQGLTVSHTDTGASGAGLSGSASLEQATAVAVIGEDMAPARAKPILRGIREIRPQQPVILVTPDEDVAGRAAVVGLVDLVLSPRVGPHEIVTEARHEIVRRSHPLSVSVFGDKAERLIEPLWRRGLAARAEDRIESLVEQVAAGEVRAVIVTPHTAPLRPEQVLRVLRTDPRTRSVTIVHITETEPDRIADGLRRDADEVVSLRLDADRLAMAVKFRLARRAELEPIVDVGRKRGVLPWTSAEVIIERLLMDGFRRHMPIGFALLELPALDDGLDEQIAREFRRGDVVTRHSGDHLLIVLPGVSGRTMLHRLEDLQQRFDLVARQCRAVALEFPLDGRSAAAIVEEGAGLLALAAAHHAPWAVPADWRPWSADAPDVVLIDPDLTLGPVLEEALARRGLRVMHQPDALAALAHLSGRTEVALPRLVIMDLDQRGIDGLQLLRRLREAGTLRRCDVLVLSARAHEADLRLAFELGAADFVAKPFSLPLLVHRLERMLER